MNSRRREPSIEASGDGAIAAGGNIENVTVHVGDVYTMDSLPLKVAALDHSAALADADVENFVGREWLTDRIEELAAGPASPGRYILVRARAGLGKTALAAWLTHRWGCAHHFTRTVGGRDTRTTLQSLAAQLIVHYRMQDEFAPSGMMPTWVGDPARFPTVLRAAALRAMEQGEQVRIVVDGLDEAAGDGPALGLPQPREQPLPDGVVIVATHREGLPARRIPQGDTVHTMRIDADGPENRDDIRRFLAREVRDGEIAGRLTAAGLSEQDAIDLLAKRCDGVWIYLRYALAQVRVDPSAPLDMDTLPSGLAGYYRQQITGHRDEPRFFTTDLPVLSTLAVAGQPMSRDQLGKLSGVTLDDVRRLCDVRYRPFLVIDAAAAPPRYSIYHASLREFLHGHRDPEDPDQDPVDASDLADAVHAAHHRIADYYLTTFGSLYGGLDRCLPALRADPDLAELDHRYPLRHLPDHLHRAGRHHDLDVVLSCRSNPDARLGSLWRDTHDRAGTLDDYLAALALLRDVAEQETDRLIAAGMPAVSLATETRCAVLAADLIRSDAIPATLLDALARTGVWDVDRALWHAHRKLDPQERAKALTALALRVDDDNAATWTRSEVLADALEAARAIRLDWYRPAALAEVAVRLREPASTRVLDEGLTTAVAIADATYRLMALEAVVGHLTDPGQLARAIEAAWAFDRDFDRAEAMAVVAPRLPEPDRTWLLRQAVDIVLTVTGAVPAARVLTKLATVVPGPVRQEIMAWAFDAALATPTWGGHRGRAIAQLAGAADDPTDLDRAFAAGLAIDEPDERAATLAAIAARMPEPIRTEALRQALDVAATTEDRDRKRAMALLAVAERMSGPDRTQALGRCLDAVAAMAADEYRGWALADTAGQLTEPAQVSRALDIALLPDDRGNRITALTNIAAHVTQPEPLSRVFAALRAIPADWTRADAVTKVAEGITDPAGLAQAAEVARTIAEAGPRARTLAAVAGRMSEPARAAVVDEAFEAIGMASKQPWDQTRALRVLAAEAARQPRFVEVALTITDAKARCEALLALADELLEPVRASVLTEAVAAARAISGSDRTVKLAATANRLGEAAQAALLAEVLDSAATTTSDVERSQTLLAVAGALTDPADLDRALDAALACQKPDCQAKALAAVAARLPEPARTGLLRRALDTAIALPEPRERAWTLYEVANRTTDPDLLAQAAEAALFVADSDWVFAVGAATRDLPEPQRHRVQTRVLDRATADLERAGPAERQLSAITAGLTDPGHLARVLGCALGMEPDLHSGTGAWTFVFSRVVQLGAEFAPSDFVRLLRQAFRTLPRTSVVFDIISSAAPVIARVGGQPALTGQLDLIL